MRVKDFAEAEGVSIHKVYRAMKKLGREIAAGGRYNGTELTEVDMDLIRPIIEKKRGKDGEAMSYSRMRGFWVGDWASAIARSDFKTHKELSDAIKVFGVLSAAKTREVLDTPVYGARLGDMVLEVISSLTVESMDDESSFWHYLKSEGFESPGWEIL